MCLTKYTISIKHALLSLSLRCFRKIHSDKLLEFESMQVQQIAEMKKEGIVPPRSEQRLWRAERNTGFDSKSPYDESGGSCNPNTDKLKLKMLLWIDTTY